MKITKAYIRKFRGFEDVEFNIGTHLTAIAGQNGTQKTTLLGILSQTFSLTDKENPIVINKEKPLCGGQYRSYFSEKFKLSPTFDRPKTHEWTLFFDDDNDDEGFTIESIQRSNSTDEIRFWKKGDRTKGSGYKQIPVIYLSLSRILPLGEDNEIRESSEVNLDSAELEFFKKEHNNILKITRNDVKDVNYLASKNKNTLGVDTDYYDWKMNSSGQDNVGKIILAIMSFQRLKSKYPQVYNGGILVIDEIETTLYPASQLALIDFLRKYASKLNLQVIFSTHSLEVLERTCTLQDDEKLQGQTKVVFLEKIDNKVKIANEISFSGIKHKLNISLAIKSKGLKINTFTEDAEGLIFIKGILKSTRSKNLNYLKCKMGCSNYIELVTKKIHGFGFPESLIILDGDVKNERSSMRKIAGYKNFLVLPKNDSPERELAKFLDSLSDESPYWNEIYPNYSHQFAFRDHSVEEIMTDRIKAKAWFQSQIRYWGNGCTKIINSWAKENSVEVGQFIEIFDSKILEYKKALGEQ